MQLKKFSPAAQKVLTQCRIIAKKNHGIAVEPEHLALALILTPELRQLLVKKNVEHKVLADALLKLIANLPGGTSLDPVLSSRFIQALSFAEAFSLSKGHSKIFVSDLLLSLLENRNQYGSLGSILAQFLLGEKKEVTTKTTKIPPKGDLGSALLEVSDNLNELVKKDMIDPVFDRDQEILRMVQVLCRKARHNPLLIGEAGVGRASIVHGFVSHLLQQRVPSHLISKEVLSLDIPALVAGTTLRGQFEERMRKVLTELGQKKGQYILFIRDLSLLMGAGGEGAADAANLLKPSLEKGLIQVIGLVTPDAYKRRIENDPSFHRNFQPIWISQPSNQDCYNILLGLKEKYEQFHGVFIEDAAIKAAIDLGARHLSGGVLPELAIQILDEACSRHRIAIDETPKEISQLYDELASLKAKAKGLIQAKKKTLKAPRKGTDKMAKVKALIDEKMKNYENEVSIIQSMRAIKTELAQSKGDIEHEKRKGDTLMLDSEILKVEALEKEFKKKQNELARINKSKRLIDPWIKPDDIAEIISQQTGIPAKKMMQSEREKLANMEKTLSQSVIGQNRAIEAVSNAIRRARVGLKDNKKPIGSFLFLGPTGVGKTQLARTLTNFLFDDERAMIRFDMSEFMERHSVARLIGAPPGYLGAEEGGQLTEAVKRKPYSVVLFDEIEKAHKDVLNVLLQVLDDGRLTDSKGHLVNFNNTVIIMTSNVGADLLLDEQLPKEREKVQKLVLDRLLMHLRPELVNRIDEIVIFEAMDLKSIKGICDILLKELIQRLKTEGFDLKIEPLVKEYLIREGFNKKFGARPLKRSIQRLLENPLAMEIIEGKLQKGGEIRAYIGESKNITFDHS